MRQHAALLGDSILDNQAYTGGEPDVATHLRTLLPPSWTVTLYAEDGATTTHLATQLRRVQADVTHLIVAIGGNDALQNLDLLSRPVASTAEALTLFSDRLAGFRRSYSSAIDDAAALKRELTVCTIYNGALEVERAELARVGLMMFNDVILQAAVERRLGVIELRGICTEAVDYANPIEPSGTGGAKIARAIAHAIGAVPAPVPCRIWSGC